jgi:hypothetical protein
MMRYLVVATTAVAAMTLSMTAAAAASPDPVGPLSASAIDGIEVTGDWNGDGTDTPGLFDFRTATWYLRNANSEGVADVIFKFGNANEPGFPVVGDWNGDGTDTPGLVRDNTWYLRNANSAGAADLTFIFGNTNEVGYPLVGDWNGDGTDTPGLVRDNTWYLRNTNSQGPANLTFAYGNTNETGIPVVGDWNGDGTDTPGLVRSSESGSTWYLRNANSRGPANLTFAYGSGFPFHLPLPGDWNGDSTDTVGMIQYRAGAATLWLLRNANTRGVAEITFTYGFLPN